MSLNKSQSPGFTTIEIVLGIVVVGIVFVGFMSVHANIRSKSTNTEIILRATGLASSVMGKIRAHDFHDDTAPASTLGPDEASASDYDDVDDYAGFDWSITGYDGYSVNTRVFYVNPVTSWLDSVGTSTYYKRIIVSVSHGGLESALLLTSLITPHQI